MEVVYRLCRRHNIYLRMNTRETQQKALCYGNHDGSFFLQLKKSAISQIKGQNIVISGKLLNVLEGVTDFLDLPKTESKHFSVSS